MEKSKTQITIVGEIVEIGEVRSFSNGKFRKQEITIKDDADNPKYPQWYKVTFKQDNIGKLEGWLVGDSVCVTGFVNGNKWEKKDAQGNVEKTMFFLEVDAVSIREPAEEEQATDKENLAVDYAEVEDDMPF